MTYHHVIELVMDHAAPIELLPKQAAQDDHHDHHGNADNDENGNGGTENDRSVIAAAA